MLLSFLGKPLEPDGAGERCTEFSHPEFSQLMNQIQLTTLDFGVTLYVPYEMTKCWFHDNLTEKKSYRFCHRIGLKVLESQQILDKTLGKIPPSGIPMLCKCRSPWVAARRCTKQTTSFLINYQVIILHQHWLGQLFSGESTYSVETWNTSTQQNLTHSRCEMI